ncbi:MAG: 1-(5-phosphoribosyl)-5-[(5-phosphoribosylamino)methylideneamino]imidazole-4-carboxamide isomerase [Oscillospiraceae bacterium]|jgi:phosphoribosylformimino-5-aminoimidazole carboxamide ribotide isomerase|nr:1-(5-phosphoribosyl)-5-[(5-phosphoribosylamino)methylideneamino]imidazole-4-carboxamide isomerase [Oscillospiraceae bacterium]
MKIFPAIDLRGGRVVRLTQGDYARMDVYCDDPVAQAKAFAAAGAKNIHLVDLDGAKEGKPVNFSVIRAIIEETGLFAEVGGGIRDEERVEMYLRCGAGRVILGTAALENPAFLRKMLGIWGEKIAVGVDARDGFVCTRGWEETSQTAASAFCVYLRDIGVKTVIFTDIARDGALQGCNLESYRALCKIEGLQVIASGGICSYEELTALKGFGCAGAILGKSLYTGALNLETALAQMG